MGDGEYDEKTATPIVIICTQDKIYMLFSYDDFAPSNADPDKITCFVKGELENGDTFLAYGPGPGWMRRP
jgi:hypothetical protein